MDETIWTRMLHESEINVNAISQRLKTDLLAIHAPKVDFQLIFTTRTYARRLGTYYIARKLIYVHGGRGGYEQWLDTAIHEYAHHIHHTEVDANVGDNKVHGKTFNFIYNSLLACARQSHLFQRSNIFTR